MNKYETGQVILVDKPLKWTSFDVVRKIRSLIKIKKVGHAGTLDPLATGLLILCTGKFTKKINEYMGMEKEYTGTFILGAVTSTYDLESEPTSWEAAVTEAVVSNVPPSHAPPTTSGIPIFLIIHGKTISIGIATSNTSVVT